MQPARLGFATHRPPALMAGWLLLGVGLVMLALIYRSGEDTRAELARTEGRLWQVRGRQSMPVARVVSPAEQEAGQKLAAELGQRWDLLFSALEQAQTPGVDLTLVYPDPARRLVRLAGRARDMDAVVAYLRHLQRSGVLRRAHLTQQAPKEGSLEFQLQAEWTP